MTRLLSVRRALAAGALVPLALTGLTGCRGESPSSGAADPEPSSTGRTSAGPAADPSAGRSATPTPAPPKSERHEIAPAEFAAMVRSGLARVSTAHMTMRSTLGPLGELTGAGDIAYTTPPTMTMNVAVPGSGRMEMRMVGGLMYVRIPHLTGAKFYKLDLAGPNGPLAGLESLDPRESYRMLEKGVRSVKFLGREGVGGQSLDHYKVVADPQVTLDTMSLDLPPGASIPSTVATDVWLDAKHRVARLVVRPYDVGTTRVTLSLTMSDWGKEVDVQPPPAGQVLRMPTMAGSAS